MNVSLKIQTISLCNSISCIYYLNALNLQLQGKLQNVAKLVGYADGFRKKRELLCNNDVTQFPTCLELSNEVDHVEFCRLYVDVIRALQDSAELRSSIELFNNPMGVSVDQQLANLPQTDAFLLFKRLFSRTILEIGVSWPFSTFTRLCFVIACVQCLVVLSAYTCEAAFSATKHIKSMTRNRLERDFRVMCATRHD